MLFTAIFSFYSNVTWNQESLYSELTPYFTLPFSPRFRPVVFKIALTAPLTNPQGLIQVFLIYCGQRFSLLFANYGYVQSNKFRFFKISSRIHFRHKTKLIILFLLVQINSYQVILFCLKFKKRDLLDKLQINLQ